MTDYKCGHKTSGLIIIDSNPVSMSAYLEWSETVGINGSREKCWACWCSERK